MSALTWEEMERRYARACAIANRYEASIDRQMRAALRRSGLGGDSVGDWCAAHNAWISAREGKPWREVDYAALGEFNRLERTRKWRASRIADAYWSRLVREWQRGGCQHERGARS